MTHFGILRSPRAVLFGPGQRHAVGKTAKRLGRRVFVCTDAWLAASAMFPSVIDSLKGAGLEVKVFDGSVAELPLESVHRAAAVARPIAPDLIVGIGGGSSLDTAKLTGVVLAHGDNIPKFYGESQVPGPILPMIAMPTTSGTGSEVSPVAVVTDPDRTIKVGVSSAYLVPDVAICDPELTYSCPPGLTANSGVDALTHAIEAFTAIRRGAPALDADPVFIGKNDLSDHHALIAIRYVANSLMRAIKDGNDATARGELMLGALYAGYAFGTAGTAAAHAIQYPLGAATHSAHGIGVATLLPYVMEYNRPERVAEFAQIAMAMDPTLQQTDPHQLAEIAVDKVSELLYAAGVPRTLSELGLREDQVRWTAEQAAGVARLIKNNPRALDLEGIERITRAAFVGERTMLRAA